MLCHSENRGISRIQTQAAREDALIYFADEARIRSDYHSGTTWAPVANTPVVERTEARFSVDMLSAVTPAGTLRFMVNEGNTTAAVSIDFCKRLLHDARGPGYLIVDGHPAHRAKATQRFVASTAANSRTGWPPCCRKVALRTATPRISGGLTRMADLIARLFRVQYTLCGVSMSLHRMRFSP
ncbi:transposase [Saccharopolyspora karakumensis]|nr:transposase [Saccharopolyspora karakumensis]